MNSYPEGACGVAANRKCAPSTRAHWVIIGISGVTCGGKTTLANRLMDALSPAYVFHQDQYFYPDDSPHHVKCEGLAHNNYDILSALDMSRMHSDVLKCISGGGGAHASSAPGRRGCLAPPPPARAFLILEGFTTLNYRPLLELCDLRYYFVLEYSECALRRAFRLYDPPDIDGYFDTCVWPEHIKYRAEIERDSRVRQIDGTQHDALEQVLQDLKVLGVKEID